MITFNTLGRFGKLGNQMFQYAALFALANKNNYEFGIPYINTEWGKSVWYDCKLYLPEIFNISAKDSSLVKNNNQFFYDSLIYNSHFDYLPDNIDMFGYFQSEKYFKFCKNKLLKEFSFKNNNLYDSVKKEFIDKKFIGLHIRRGDYLELSNIHKICDNNYYLKSLNKIFNEVNEEYFLYIFSDDIEWCKNNLNISGNVFFDESPESNIKYYTNQEKTLMKMSLCDHFICANSSFSWWGSYLIQNPNKIICMPKEWFGEGIQESWADIYYDGVTIL